MDHEQCKVEKYCRLECDAVYGHITESILGVKARYLDGAVRALQANTET
jgi:hypothetical protein